MGSACYLDNTASEWRHITSLFRLWIPRMISIDSVFCVFDRLFCIWWPREQNWGSRTKSVVQTTRETVTERRLEINSFSASHLEIIMIIIIIFNNIYWFVLRKYQSRERNFHLRITLTQQNPKILVHFQNGLIYRSFLKISKNNNLKIKINL